ncbi:MAG: efflux RND transporter permease subunit [Candidatus Marinimicrobia bacterium]|jgi:Cu(I)/Ag(I) efflux system membrane protein CusA/SilA|nr:efflux RND transporter permease subunit [Candidatus Neomarinimicrobiota bacterium]|tara:strand:+ start:3122 stop:6901 length:3780 start_codon:yes stop_codon:yes gene_type:complete
MSDRPSLLDKLIRYCLENKLIVALLFLVVVAWGIMVAPFDWDIPGLPRDPVPVDAIPDIGENQQIVFTQWMGRSPQDVEDQITYPLTVALLGVPEVKTVRSYSMFGFSTIYVIFNEEAEFYWSRSRILEKLNSLPSGTLPDGVQPALGPDATALGQVFWYTLEGRDENGNPTGGWDLDELRSLQDWYVRYALLSAEGVAEAASVGGYVKEYQIDVDPAAMREHKVRLTDIFQAVRASNVDVGARTIEVNRVEYIVRGLGFIRSLEDVEEIVVKVSENVPIYVKDVAHVTLGPALRRGILDKGGAEVVGGVVVTRFGENPLATIKHVKEKIREISPGLPKKTLADGTVSQVSIVPFYDRTGLIYETLGTLNHALRDEILITIVVVLIMLMHFRSSLMITSLLPLTILIVFIGMKQFGVDANIVALSGIAIAIGTIVDMGIVVTENILKHLDEAGEDENIREVLLRATSEVGGAVVTAVSTTVVSFLPVFTMQAAEGKLFVPLAYTKTFALIASVIVALTILPPMAHVLFSGKVQGKRLKSILNWTLVGLGVIVAVSWIWWIGLMIAAIGGYHFFRSELDKLLKGNLAKAVNWVVILLVVLILASTWAPLGVGRSFFLNAFFVALVVAVVMGLLVGFTRVYPRLLRWSLDHKAATLSVPGVLLILGLFAWMGFGNIFGFLPEFVTQSRPFAAVTHLFPGLGKEFMPPLDEGSYLYMPTTMPHAGMEESIDVLQKIDKALYSVPEVELVVGKAGRAETPLDPAPISMIETVVSYKSEYITDKDGNHLRFKIDDNGEFVNDGDGNLVPDSRGKPFRQWRDHIRTAADIWDELVKVAQIPGTTSAPRLQPISARIVMLQSGMRAPMGIKVKGPNLETIEKFGLDLEKHLKNVPSVKAAAVFADRIVGKPYLEINISRESIARYGISLRQVQDVIEVAIGGKRITSTVEGRERYPVRVRYMRELRGDIESLTTILVPAPDGTQIPIQQMADIHYIRGPQVIKSEDTFLVGYVLFDKNDGWAEVDVVEQAQSYLEDKVSSGELMVPAGVSYAFAGSYENQIRATEKLRVILPLALFVILLILYFQFRRLSTSIIVFSGIFVAWAGGFLMIWLYGQGWFMNFNIVGMNMRELFQMHPVNLSVAVWVGFLALFGIASDNGVIISTYLEQSFARMKPKSITEIRNAAAEAGTRRIRPAMMTAGTTILALIPILTSTGRGADVMVPMAIPSFGGMVFAILTTFVVPLLYAMLAERRMLRSNEASFGKKRK